MDAIATEELNLFYIDRMTKFCFQLHKTCSKHLSPVHYYHLFLHAMISRKLIWLSCLAFLLSSCGSTEEEVSTEDWPTLRVSYSEWPGDLIVYLAEEKGFFEDEELHVELVPVANFEETFENVDLNKVDIWALTLLDTVLLYSMGADWDILMLEDFSNGADAIVTLPDNGILSVSDLAGQVVGVEQGTVGEFFLKIVLERQDLSLDDLTLVNLTYDEIPNALLSGEIDAGVTYEPAVTEIVNQGGTVVLDSSQERGVIVDVFLGMSEAIQENPEVYKKFIRAMLNASDYYNQNPEEAVAIMAEAFGTDPEELMLAFEGLEIPDLQDNLTAFDRSSGYASLAILSRQAQQFLYEQALIEELVDLEPLFSDLIKDLEE